MDNVLKILNETRDELLAKITEVELDIRNWNTFIKSKSSKDDNLQIDQKPQDEKKHKEEKATNDTKTFIDEVFNVIKDNGREMYSSQIAEKLIHLDKGNGEKWLGRRVSSVLSDDKSSLKVYGVSRKEKGQHHLAKVWGLKSFKDGQGNVKPEHKYKSTL